MKPRLDETGENVRSGGSHGPLGGGLNSAAPGAAVRREMAARSLKLSSSVGVTVTLARGLSSAGCAR